MRFRALVFTVMAFAGWLLLSAAVSAQPVNVDAAKKEGKLVIYGTIVPKVMALIQKGFEAQYGIKVEYWRGDATKVIDRVLTEWRAGKPNFDVVIGARGPLALAKPEGVFAKYSPPGAANFPAKFKDKDGQFTAMRVTPVGILYNTELVKGADVPKTFDDLLESKWQGQISMPDPSRHASTAQFLWNMEQLKGEKWMDFVRGLAKQKPHLVESYSSVPNTIVRGETAVGITYVQYAGQFKGPISFAPLDKVFADPSDAALSAKSPNVNAGKLFIEYLCSTEGQKTVAGTGEFVLAPGIYPNIKGADKIMDSLLLMNDASSERLAKLQGEFRQLFIRK
ncbi:MAG TPA: extracellular solute-binding protein [Candidatus Binatia bacterium]|jgi:ABC-type Fe3+ transport system substrate-binding protein